MVIPNGIYGCDKMGSLTDLVANRLAAFNVQLPPCSEASQQGSDSEHSVKMYPPHLYFWVQSCKYQPAVDTVSLLGSNSPMQ